MAAGVIYMNIHKLDLNEIRGFGRKKPLLAFVYLMGALGIGGFPMWSGYISKTLLHESIVEYIHGLEGAHIPEIIFSVENMQLIEWIFLISGGMTVAYMCKLFVAVFLEKNRDEKLQAEYDAKKQYMKPVSALVLTVSALLFPVMGVFPYQTLDRIADMSESFMGWNHGGHPVNYFTWTNLQGSLISIGIGVVIYFLIIRTLLMKKEEDGSKVYVNRWWKCLDLEDYFYRPVLLKILPAICGVVCLAMDRLVDGIVVLLRKSI